MGAGSEAQQKHMQPENINKEHMADESQDRANGKDVGNRAASS